MNEITAKTLPLDQALKKPSGARFYRCALQVNPYAYQGRHGNSTSSQDEADYNQTIIKACLDNKIEAIAVTDHYRVSESQTLIKEARDAGIFVFGGFEASSKDGVHFLCLFDPEHDSSLERFIGELGIRHNRHASPIGNRDCEELVKCVREQGGIAIAAHATAESGLLKTLKGQPRINAWRSDDLYACAIPGPIDDVPQNYQNILKNKEPEHFRIRPVAVLNTSDANNGEDLAKDRSTTLIKMTDLSIEGLRQAFLDPESRIRLNSDPVPDTHLEFTAMTWEGGFLDGSKIHFNGNLNVLIGGRGTGKSTVIESLRFVLDLPPLGDEAKRVHEGIVKYVIKSGTKVSLRLRSYNPTQHDYIIERTNPHPPTVKGENGEVLNLKPKDIVSGMEVFGQHEISELTKSPEKLTNLLERFVERDNLAKDRRSTLDLELDKLRGRISEIRKETTQIEDKLPNSQVSKND